MRISPVLSATLALLGGWAMAVNAAASPSFNGLGFLPGGNYYSAGIAVSGDGAVVVGTAGTVRPSSGTARTTALPKPGSRRFPNQRRRCSGSWVYRFCYVGAAERSCRVGRWSVGSCLG